MLAGVDPWMLAGPLYLGSRLGLGAWRRLCRAEPLRLPPGLWPWLVGAVLAGGVVGPLLLLVGLSRRPASDEAHFSATWSTLAVLGACVAWAIDNNLTRKVALNDASWIASIKSSAAGSVNLLLALGLHLHLSETRVHEHSHEPIEHKHAHAHFPDAHHRHPP